MNTRKRNPAISADHEVTSGLRGVGHLSRHGGIPTKLPACRQAGELNEITKKNKGIPPARSG